MRPTSRAALALVGFVAACADTPVVPTDSSALPSFAATADPLADRYLVIFKPGTRNADQLTNQLAAGRPVHARFTTALQGFSATIPAAALEGIRRNPNVAFVEADQEVTASATQTGATWGLDRIDQRDLPLSTTYSYDATGAGVRAYILDTGILTGHVQFTGRLASGFTAISDGRGTSDCNGHGTHVAGTVGGTTHGVAKGVTLVPVRVLNCQGSGTTTGVVQGIDWVATNAQAPAVANMSLGGGASSAIDQAVANAVARGITFVVAAGNSNANACNYSPARAPSAITVGATTSTDARASYSNFGSCLDLFAPGSSITSAWYTSTTATNTISGTSMASPHVAGAAALLLQGTPTASPATIAASLTGTATTGKVGSAGTGSPNLLLFTGAGGSEPPPPSGDVAVDVSGITGSSTTSGNGRNWTARATISVTGSAAGVTVSGRWSTSGTTYSCTTDGTGRCTISSPTYKTNQVSSVTFSVTGVGGTGFVWNPDLSTAATMVTVSR
ncbi:MAG TPA: S8 family serine peptidase [Gemmatimonadales bacterium]|nr:S8 family serine peptidase [Gemmatimonadales bacterium]